MLVSILFSRDDEFIIVVCLLFLVIGRSVVIHKKDKGAGRLACADIKPFSSEYNMETLNVKNTSKTR